MIKSIESNVRGIKNIPRNVNELKRTLKRRVIEARSTTYKRRMHKPTFKISSDTLKKRIRKSYRDKLNLPAETTANTRNSLTKGGALQPTLVLSYTSNNIPVSKLMSKASVSTSPIISILNTVPNTQYLIIMTDPDAPMGTFTHMISVYDSKTKKTSDFIQYYPPTPPSGTHRYITEMYDFTNKTISELPKFSDNVLYTPILMNYIKLQSLKKVGNTVRFTVNAN